MPGTRKLGRTSDHRKAMLRAMVTYLLENGRIETTVTRAKEVRSMAEKMITTAKTNDLHSRRQVLAYVTKEDVVKKLFDEIAPKYAERNGGYTRIYKTGPRRGDAAEMAIIIGYAERFIAASQCLRISRCKGISLSGGDVLLTENRPRALPYGTALCKRASPSEKVDETFIPSYLSPNLKYNLKRKLL